MMVLPRSGDMRMRFDRYTMALLVLREDAPQLDDAASDALQDAHLAHLASLHEAGHLLAAGPLMGEPAELIRGLCIFGVEPALAHELLEQDPAVRIGRLAVKILPWTLPAGAIAFSPTRFPRSMAEAAGP
jgi:uncharacterized protein YciI